VTDNSNSFIESTKGKNMLNSKSLFMTVLLLSVTACVSNLSPIPLKKSSWYGNYQNLPNHWIGFGEASISENATKRALSNIAGQISTTVNSSVTDQIWYSRNNDEERLQEKTSIDVMTSTEDVTIRGYSIERSEKIGGQYYVMVKVEKNKFFQERLDYLNSLDKELNKLVSELKTQLIAVQLKAMPQIKQKVAEAQKIATMLKAFSQLPNPLSYYLDRYSKMRDEEKRIREAIRFYIHHKDEHTALVAKYLKQQINKENFIGTKVFQTNPGGKFQNNPKVAYVQIEGKMINKTLHGAFMTKLIVSITVSALGKEISSREGLVFSGSSASSYSTSLRAASNEFEDDVKKNRTLKTLGLIE
jgi:vacuolar-type H+-ATPase subunit F/Vma7